MKTQHIRSISVLALIGVLGMPFSTPLAATPADEAVTVYAAASLTGVLQTISAEAGLRNVRFSFAASSTLARQIDQGAPAHVFISADEEWMQHAQKSGRIDASTRRDIAGNRLVLVAPGAAGRRDAPESDAAIGAALDAALAVPGARIATGDPSHVPAGRYAQAALARLGLWSRVEPRLARADNVRAALLFVERGEAPLGIVYRSDALASAKVHMAALFPAASHAPIRYPAALLKGAPQEARRFLDHLGSPAARAILRRAGFEPP